MTEPRPSYETKQPPTDDQRLAEEVTTTLHALFGYPQPGVGDAVIRLIKEQAPLVRKVLAGAAADDGRFLGATGPTDSASAAVYDDDGAEASHRR